MRKLKFSLSTNIIIGLILGIGTGLFFGDSCKNLDVIGNVFIQLLQMSVLPYIVVSLIHGIGSLSYNTARMLAIKGGILMLVYWAIAFVYILLMPLCFPNWETSSFFSKSSVAPPPNVDYLQLYIPSNPFGSMAQNLVPAVVLFSMFVGVALIGIKEKKRFLEDLSVLNKALSSVANLIVCLTPLGVFAISASAAGTMTIEEFGRMQVFFTTYIAASVLITFFVLPLLTSMLTPFKYGEVIAMSKDAMITAFTTGNLFIILPLISENAKKLFDKYNCETNETDSLANVIIPITFNFPNIGKLLTLVFILFCGWYTGNTIGVLRYPDFILSGLLSLFGGADVAVPFLLNHMQLPADLFQIYLVAGILNGKFATLLAAMNLFTFTLICVASLIGKVRFSLHRIMLSSALVAGISVAILFGTRLFLSTTVKNKNEQVEILSNMAVQDPVKMVIHSTMPEKSYLDKLLGSKPSKKRLKDIKNRKVLRVGYNPKCMPFTFFNLKGNLVGFDVSMANLLAKELECTLEFFPFEYDNIAKGLDDNIIDIAMSCVSIDYDRIKKMNFTEPYMELNLALVVKDHQKELYQSSDDLNKMKDLKLAVLKGSAYADIIRRFLPSVKLLDVESQQEFFSGKMKADALLTTAEQGSAWAIIHPAYTVVVPKPDIHKNFIAYPIATGDLEFLNYLNYWLKIQKANGVVDKLYSYWVLGETTEEKPPRWCILRDVLGYGKKSEQ